MNSNAPPKAAQKSARPENAGLLALVSDLLAQQNRAILSGNTAVLNRLFETLSGLVGDMEDSRTDLSSADADEIARIKAQAAALREQIALNQKLLSNGMAVSDHFVRSVAEFDSAIVNPLFSGVA